MGCKAQRVPSEYNSTASQLQQNAEDTGKNKFNNGVLSYILFNSKV
jgi:hypothetical protein